MQQSGLQRTGSCLPSRMLLFGLGGQSGLAAQPVNPRQPLAGGELRRFAHGSRCPAGWGRRQSAERQIEVRQDRLPAVAHERAGVENHRQLVMEPLDSNP
jgi:hypothetical protein